MVSSVHNPLVGRTHAAATAVPSLPLGEADLDAPVQEPNAREKLGHRSLETRLARDVNRFWQEHGRRTIKARVVDVVDDLPAVIVDGVMVHPPARVSYQAVRSNLGPTGFPPPNPD